jgi:hypothetical protein
VVPPRSSGATSASRLHEDARAVLARPLAVGAGVRYADGHGMGDLAGPRRPAVTPYVADDHGAFADAELGAVVLADPHLLGEAESRRQPGNGLAPVGIDQDGMTAAAGMERLGFMRAGYWPLSPSA